MRYFGIGKRIPIAFTKDADPKDLSDAIDEFIEKYESQVSSKRTNSGEYSTEKTNDNITKSTIECSKRKGDTD